jgi:hypothetical protein
MPPNAIDAAIEAMRPSRNGAASLVAPPKPLTIYAGNIYGRGVEPLHWMSMDALRSASFQREHGVRVMFRPNWNDALLCRSRSVTATAFLLKSDADVHVSIDGDVIFEPQQVAQIARQAVEYGMVGGIYITRSRADARPTSIFEPGQTIVFGADPTPQPVRWVATGFLATHRRVFERLAEDLPLCHEDREWSFYPFYAPFWVENERTGGTLYLSEDFALCERARRAGFTPHIAPNIRIYHYGGHPFSLEDCVRKPLEEREIAVTYQEDGRFRFETHAD